MPKLWKSKEIRTLIAGVVQVREIRLPVRRQRRRVNSVTVVLAGDVAAAGGQVQGRDVVSPVAVLQLDGATTGSQSQELVAEADAENGNLGGFH